MSISQDITDRLMMSRALQLARFGSGRVSPNPMVGAVITSPDGRIIGEGWHRYFGGPHAEVNAVRSVKESDRHLLPHSTIYVTLEPCSHYGKTPPCAQLLTECGFKRAVVAIEDPNPQVAGRGLRMLREAGCKVAVGIMAREATELNRRFLTVQKLGRPWIQLKWCESADKFIGKFGENGQPSPCPLSSPLGKVWMHRHRSMCDAIVIGSGTAITDRPRLTLRSWPGKNPARVVADRRKRVDLETLFPDGNAFRIGDHALRTEIERLGREYEIGAIMVEGGSTLLQSFLDENLFDEIRVEHSPIILNTGVAAPEIPASLPSSTKTLTDGNTVTTYRNPIFWNAISTRQKEITLIS